MPLNMLKKYKHINMYHQNVFFTCDLHKKDK